MSLRSRLIFLAILTVLCVVIAIPSTWKDSWKFPAALSWLTEPHINKGLDLAGGVGLDFKVDMTKVPADRKPQVISGIREVLNGRVNTLGVSEPEIVPMMVGDEDHIRVTLAGVNDIEQAKKIIGKTIQLEFKVPREGEDKDLSTRMRTAAEQLLKEWSTKPADRASLIEKAKQGDQENKVFEGNKTLVQSAMDPAILKALSGLKEGEFAKEVVEGSVSTDTGQELSSVRGMIAAKLTKKAKELVRSPSNGVTMEDARKEFGDNKSADLGMLKSGSDLGKKTWLATQMKEMLPGQVSDVLDTEDGFVVLKMKSQYKEGQEVIKASHILFLTDALTEVPATATGDEKKKLETAYAATAAKNDLAKQKANDVLARLKKDPATFDQVAKEYTEEPGGRDRAGDLGYFSRGDMVPEFDTAAFNLENGQISEVVKSQFGYHIIKATDKKPKEQTWAEMEEVLVCYKGAKDPSCATATRTKDEAKSRADAANKKLREEDAYSFEYVLFDTTVDPWVPAVMDGKQLTGEYFKRADAVYQDGSMVPIVRIEFTPEGATLFEQLTEKYTNKQMAIFVGGELISAPTIRGKIPGGTAVIEGGFKIKDAVALARDLNTGAIPAPITLSGQEIVGPELGQGAFEKSLLAGLVGIVILSIYLIGYYRFSGLLAVLSLFVYTIMYITVIKIVPGFNLTLASVAALILSVGMAVDGNVLIFERFKEEMSKSGNVQANIKKAFERAWSAIRDSQVSSLITALILYWLGTEAVRGFAVYLIFGILLSLFTSVWVTRTLMQGSASIGLYKAKK